MLSVHSSVTRSTSKKGGSGAGQSVYSQSRQIRQRQNLREEMISKKITEIFKEKESKMLQAIEQTIYDDKLRIYKAKRAIYDDEINELDKERQKIIKARKMNKNEGSRQLRQNNKKLLLFYVRALQETIKYYKELYYENDFYRQKKLQELVGQQTGKRGEKALLDQLIKFFSSPFKDDRMFVVKYMAQLTRDRLSESTYAVDALFFDKIFNILFESDETSRQLIFDIICNLIGSESQRKRLASQGYFKKIYTNLRIGEVEEKTLTKMAWMTALICFHSDMIEQIFTLKLLQFMLKLTDSKFPVVIRAHAVLGISLMTYHEKIFDELVQNGVIELVMGLSIDKGCDPLIKINSTLALVHFALNKKSIQLAIDHNLMEIFTGLNDQSNTDI